MSWLSPGRWLLSGALAITAGFGLVALDQSRQAIGYKKAQTEYAAQASQADAKREALAEQIAAQQIKAQEQIRSVTKTLIQKVNVYVPSTSCPLPGGFRLLHNAAATDGEVPDATSRLDAAPVAAQAATELVIENYGIARANAAQLVGLQGWINAQRALK